MSFVLITFLCVRVNINNTDYLGRLHSLVLFNCFISGVENLFGLYLLTDLSQNKIKLSAESFVSFTAFKFVRLLDL